MISPELETWIAGQSAKLEHFFPSETLREEMYGRMVKLTEEVGELADAVASSFKRQRKEKQEVFTDDALPAEVADVLITTLLLAYKAGVDVPKALKEKMAKVDERFEKMKEDRE